MDDMVWYSGRNNYKKHTIDLNFFEPKIHNFRTEILDVGTTEYTSIHDIFYDDLKNRETKTVEVLYSGGMDSECVLRSCMINKIPVRALTGKFIHNGYALNTHDLYYAEKFCRENNIEQKIVELDVGLFFENGEHFKYLKPYYIWVAHVATHFWLFEQSTGFPVLGGEYSWPWHHEKIISPHKLLYMAYDKFLTDNNINGIGNMLGSSLESNTMFIKEHLNTMNQNPDYRGEDDKITIFKQALYERMGFGKLELRMKNYGWEMIDKNIFYVHKYTDQLIDDYGKSWAEIKWGETIARAIGGEPGTNNRH